MTHESLAGADVFRGKINCVDVILVRCGIGKVASASVATAVALKYKPHCIINTGVCGGLKDDMKIGDIILAENCRYHDVDATKFGYKLGQVPKQPEMFKSCGRLAELISEVIGKENPLHRGSL